MGRTSNVRTTREGPRSRGFTLVEMMLVLTILAIVCAMTIPEFLNARKHTNETSAVSSLRHLTTAQVQYRIRFGSYSDLTGLTGGGWVDEGLEDGEKSGYRFSSALPDDFTFAITAQPLLPGITGNRWFYVDETGVIRYREGAVPGAGDPAVQ